MIAGNELSTNLQILYSKYANGEDGKTTIKSVANLNLNNQCIDVEICGVPRLAKTFAAVATFVSLQTVLALAAAEDMEVHTVDVSSAFLNGDLDKEIYMAQPEGFAAQVT